MKHIAFAVVLVLSLLLAGCAPAAPQDAVPGEAEAEDTLLIGYTASVTGQLNVESTRQPNGLNLWIEQVNAVGASSWPMAARCRPRPAFTTTSPTTTASRNSTPGWQPTTAPAS